MPNYCWYETNEANDELTINIQYDDPNLWCTQTISLVKLSHGLLDAGDEADEVQEKYADEQNWAVRCYTQFGNESKNLVGVRSVIEYDDFTKMGHSQTAAKANLYYTEATEYEIYKSNNGYEYLTGIAAVKRGTIRDGVYMLDCNNYSNNAGAI